MMTINCNKCGRPHQVAVYRNNTCNECRIDELNDHLLKLENTLSLRISDIHRLQADIWRLQKKTNDDFKSML